MGILAIATFAMALAAVIMSGVLMMRSNPIQPQSMPTDETKDTAITATEMVVPRPLTEWGGIDVTIPNPSHLHEGVANHNMDNLATIFPAAVFHGSLAMLSGNLVLDDASDIMLAGLDETFRSQLLIQWQMQHQICVLLNAYTVTCDNTTMHYTPACTCACINPMYIAIGSACVLDCHGHGSNATKRCVCDPPYDADSNCAYMSCKRGEVLIDGPNCSTYTEPSAIPAPVCINRSLAGECLQRGNWGASTVIDAAWIACAPRFRRGGAIVVLSACAGTNPTCCATATSWWSYNCTGDTPDLFCVRLKQQYPLLLSTFDRWDDAIPHNIALNNGDLPPHILSMWFQGSTTLVACMGPSVPDALVDVHENVIFTLVDLGDADPAYGSAYRIWSTDFAYCMLDRPLGEDELVMYHTGCRGLVALAVYDTDLYADESACGTFRIVDGTIQPLEKTWTVRWANLTLIPYTLLQENLAWPVPLSWTGNITDINTTGCRAHDCNLTIVGGDFDAIAASCTPCVYSHTGLRVV